MHITDPSAKSTLGGRIQQSRTYHGLSVPQLARRLGVKTKTLENWEANRTTPRGDKALKLAGLLQIPLMWLLTGQQLEDAPAPPETGETSLIADKLERAVAMQRNLAELLIDISADVTRLQRNLDDDTDQSDKGDSLAA